LTFLGLNQKGTQVSYTARSSARRALLRRGGFLGFASRRLLAPLALASARPLRRAQPLGGLGSAVGEVDRSWSWEVTARCRQAATISTAVLRTGAPA
jgi:hypothetical protein